MATRASVYGHPINSRRVVHLEPNTIIVPAAALCGGSMTSPREPLPYNVREGKKGTNRKAARRG